MPKVKLALRCRESRPAPKPDNGSAGTVNCDECKKDLEPIAGLDGRTFGFIHEHAGERHELA